MGKVSVFLYRLKDPSDRKIETLGIHGDHIIVGKDGLYNQNLTIGELSLLRRLMWEWKDYLETIPGFTEEDKRYLFHVHTTFIRKWLLSDTKELILYSDIIDDINSGVMFLESRDNEQE